MGCGCNKRKGAVMRPPANAADRVAQARNDDRVVMHDVYNTAGEFIASYSNPVTARAEARRVDGSVGPTRTSGTAPLTLPGAPPAENPTPDVIAATG